MAKTFFITLRQIAAPTGEGEGKLAARAAAKLRLPVEDIVSCRPVRRSLDARKRRGKAVYVYHLRVELPGRLRAELRARQHPDIVFESGGRHLSLNLTDPAPSPGRPRPLVVGAGPAGLFAALRLARSGWKPILVERGDAIDARRRVVADFWRFGGLDEESNVLFGEGGAGLFSDGKLNTRHKDREGLRTILETLVECGAPESILVEAEPHVGSDLLGEVVKRIGAEIRRYGGDIRHRTRLDGLLVENGVLRGATLWSGAAETIETDRCVLAVGHSARDVYQWLDAAGAPLAAKPFAVGLRVEIPQPTIDASQFTGLRNPLAAGAASFRLTSPPTDQAGACYTFCMCPGGQVIACASEAGRLAVNGMSFHARAGDWGNAAFLSPVPPEAFGGDCASPALAGIAFQRHWEEKAFAAGRADGEYAVPASGLEDFVAGRKGPLPERRGVFRATAANLRELLPERIGRTLAEAIPAMLGRMRKVDPADAVLYGVETRTSSPVRIVRSDLMESTGIAGLYPAGEGSGYAGGIMTSALDGWKAAGCLMRA